MHMTFQLATDPHGPTQTYWFGVQGTRCKVQGRAPLRGLIGHSLKQLGDREAWKPGSIKHQLGTDLHRCTRIRKVKLTNPLGLHHLSPIF